MSECIRVGLITIAVCALSGGFIGYALGHIGWLARHPTKEGE